MKQPEKYKIEQKTLVIPGLKNRYRILQISDSHISYTSELDDEATREKAKKMTAIWTGVGNGFSQLENFDNLIDYGHEIGCDLFVFAGDMIDFTSQGNVHKIFRAYKKPGNYLAVPGNHETGEDYYRFCLKEANLTPTSK